MNIGLDSVVISQMIGGKHKDLLKDIRGYVDNAKLSFDYFTTNSYVDKKGEIRPCYFCTLKGIKYIIDNKRKTKKLQTLIDWYNNNSNNGVGEIIIKERFEDSFINKLKQSLEPLGYNLETQYQVLNYRLDGYIRELNLAIEYDEEQHRFTKEKDFTRQENIERELGCNFIRCNYVKSDAYNIGLVMNYILHTNRC